MNPLLAIMIVVSMLSFGGFLYWAMSEPQPPNPEIRDDEAIPCTWCAGTGKIRIGYPGNRIEDKTCVYCHGEGMAVENDTYSRLCYTRIATKR